MEKEEGIKGISSHACCIPVFRLSYIQAEKEFIFIEDDVKVYKRHTRLPRLNQGIRGFI